MLRGCADLEGSRVKPRNERGASRKPSRGQDRPRTAQRGPAPRGARDDRGLGGTQIEGRQAVRELLLAGRRRVHEIVISEDLESNPVMTDILDLARDQRIPVRKISRRELERDARSEAPQGVIAFAQELTESDLADFLASSTKRKPFLIAIDGVTDPGNLGAILRSCDGAGVDGVILPRHRAVHITPTAAKSAAGAVEYVPMCIVGGLPTALRQLKESGVWIVGLHDAADKSIFDLGDLALEPICLVLGAEGAGLSRLVRERCDVLVSIPMLGSLSSLNVSAATALATYEIVRARRA